MTPTDDDEDGGSGLELNKKEPSLPKLRAMCRRLGLDDGGRKADILQRLEAYVPDLQRRPHCARSVHGQTRMRCVGHAFV